MGGGEGVAEEGGKESKEEAAREDEVNLELKYKDSEGEYYIYEVVKGGAK